MKSFFPQSFEAGAPGKTRRLKPGMLARRCVGSLIVLAGAVIVTGDLLAALSNGDTAATPPSPTPHQAPTAR